ncbi:PD40 domain-containing protein [Glaciecola sp. XM2]|uniref:S41 family peptidase n=1 Tax=Glaciecola sp. XM2 TaxID=1914931 RepID=UPI001BDE75CC|nr:S41 family peptidase [Glaciecola sp. XM2]MBT1451850.1 PD40 domain-containing protein [Glaciecola sp. XM2]
MKLLTSLALLVTAPLALSQALILQTEISPDGEHVAFSYQGDIWTVDADGGRATRLTIHEGYESNPVWSADSSTLAFSSDRFGNDDVYVMPKNGGQPQRLTYHSGNDRVVSFTPDNQILFNSRRVYAQVEREWEIMQVDAQGNRTEGRFMDALGFDPIVSPDGSKVAFVRGTCRVAREDYRGPANRDIWIYDRDKNTYTQLTDFDGNDFMPKWVGNDSLYFVSARSGKYNVHKATLDGEITQITDESNFGINHFSTTADGSKLAYQTGDSVWQFNTKTSGKRAINIDVTSDFRFDLVVTNSVNNRINEYAVSPNGKLSAYVHRGDIYITRNDKEDKRSVRLTTGGDRDRDVTWLNDNTLLFVSDRYDQNDLFMLTSDDANEKNLFVSLKHKVTRLTSSDEEESSPVVSPDGKKLAFNQGRGRLLTADISDDGTLSNQIVLLDGWDSPSGVAWSPDSVWLAYSLADLYFNEEVYIHAADNSSEPVNVSMHPKYDYGPVWSPDGSKLGFVSMRNNGDPDIWFAWLTKSDWQRSNEEWKRDEKSDKEKPKKAKKPEDEETVEGEDASEDAEPAEAMAIKIDFDNIYLRLQQVTRFTGGETELAFTKDGNHIYYATSGGGRMGVEADENLYKIKWDGEDKKAVIDGDRGVEDLYLSKDGKQLFALTNGGRMVSVDTKSDKSTNLDVTSTSTIDYIAEQEQIFDEAWRELGAGFYDPQFHGQDWTSLRDKYKPIALKASTKEDFQYIFNLMLGQLNASHMGMSRGDNPKETQRQLTGLLGLEGTHTEQGFEISSVLADSPADREDSQLQVGDVITAINQQSLDGKNMYSLLMNQINEPVLLNIERSGESQELVIWPTNSLSTQLYDDWVNTRRALTKEFSGGRLGYLHIRGMNWSSFERFERELMAAGYGKEGIVIDVRYNGGGWTTDYLMAVLSVKQHAYTIPRGATDDINKNHEAFKNTYPFSERLPLSAWTKPSIAMTNENSYSNAEIFSHAYQANDIGKVVGRPTFGAVISTGAAFMVDGTAVRMPFRGWWVKETGENMEFVPAKPDIEVFNPPAYKAKGVDPQLERAVQELLKDL